MRITDKTLLRVYKEDVKNGTLIIPDGIKAIAPGAISFLPNLQYLIFANTVEKVYNSAICNNPFLKKVQFSPKVKEIGSFAFNYCTSLKEISLPKSL